MAPGKVVALADMAGEQAQLPGGATACALWPDGRQTGLLLADLGDCFGARLGLVGDPSGPGRRRASHARYSHMTRGHLPPPGLRGSPGPPFQPRNHAPGWWRVPRQSSPLPHPVTRDQMLARVGRPIPVFLSLSGVRPSGRSSCASLRISPDFLPWSADKAR